MRRKNNTVRWSKAKRRSKELDLMAEAMFACMAATPVDHPDYARIQSDLRKRGGDS
jgi:hypothetical protein